MLELLSDFLKYNHYSLKVTVSNNHHQSFRFYKKDVEKFDRSIVKKCQKSFFVVFSWEETIEKYINQRSRNIFPH